MRIKAFREVFSAEKIEARVKEIARSINEKHADEPVVMVCVLKGAFMFFSDLLKHLHMGPEVDFVRIASYGITDASSGTLHLSKDVELSLSGKHVIIVEDVVDTGITMRFLLDHLHRHGARSLRVAALIDKVERRVVDVQVEYPGFLLTSGFIVGYGLDYAERHRELPAIYSVEFEKDNGP